MITPSIGTPARLAALVLAGVTLSACSAVDEHNEERGRGDAPVGNVSDEPADIVQFPDRFSNVAHACDGHGHRIYVTTKSDQSRFLTVIDDPSCTT